MTGKAAEPRGRGRPNSGRAGQRREVIVDCAYEAFVALGFAGTTTDIIATRSRVSKRTIYELFSGKADLFAAVVAKHRHLLLDLPRPADEDASLLSTLYAVFRLDMEPRLDREREALLSLVTREALQVPELSDFLYAQGIIRLREDLADWLRHETGRGRLPAIDAELCAGMLMDIVFGALLPHRREEGDAARGLRKEHIRQRLQIFLRGVR